MNNNPILHSTLTKLAQKAARPEEIDLWPNIQVRLHAEKSFSHRKEPKMNTFTKSRQLRAAYIGTLVVLLAIGMIFTIPQGRAWASTLFRFFNPAEDQRTVPTNQPVNLVEVQPGEIQPTAIKTVTWKPAFLDICGEWTRPVCSISQIEEMVDFPVKAISDIPKDFQFNGATGGPDGITLVYNRDEPASTIFIMQGPLGNNVDTAVPVGSSAIIEQVHINQAIGEYVSGGYFHFGGETTAQWISSPDIQSLRWTDGDILYTITYTGSVDPLDRESLVAIADSLVTKGPQSAFTGDTQSAGSIAEIAQKAGFDIPEPVWLPEDYLIKGAYYNPEEKLVCLEYQHPFDQSFSNSWGKPEPSLRIIMRSNQPLPDPGLFVLPNLSPDQIEIRETEIPVHGVKNNSGVFIDGSINAARLCDGANNQPKILLFEYKDLYVGIAAQDDGPIGDGRNWLTKQEMVRIAESMTEVSSTTVDLPDPEYITSIEDVQQVATFQVKLPYILPEGTNFHYARLNLQENSEEITLYYLRPMNNSYHVLSVRQISGGDETLEVLYQTHPDAYDIITIHGAQALISQGYWNEDTWMEYPDGGDGSASVIWVENGIRYSVSGFNLYPTSIWIEISENLK